MFLEVCAFNIQSCHVAQRAGAGRIELCADPLQGGTTPSYGLISYALQHISIPIYAMIRPRGGNFVYDEAEIDIMHRDILACKALGLPGIATGIQLPNGQINTEQMKQVVEWAYPMKVTCHKAFDAVPDASAALESLITAGCERVLTSGLRKTAMEGALVIAQLVAQAAFRIIIMPGGSVRSANISQLAIETGATEFHSSALLSKGIEFTADEDEVRRLISSGPY